MSGSDIYPEGDWYSGGDETGSRIELANTNQPGFVAVRSTGNRGETLITTQDQLNQFAHGVTKGQFPQVMG